MGTSTVSVPFSSVIGHQASSPPQWPCQNNWLSQFDMEIINWCPNGCQVVETVDHILNDCPVYRESQATIIALFNYLNFPFTTRTLLGYDLTLNADSQFAIRNALVSCLQHTVFLHRLWLHCLQFLPWVSSPVCCNYGFALLFSL